MPNLEIKKAPPPSPSILTILFRIVIFIGLIGGVYFLFFNRKDTPSENPTTNNKIAESSVLVAAKKPPSSSGEHSASRLSFEIQLGSTQLTNNDNFVFVVNDFIGKQPLSKPLENHLKQTVLYLQSHPSEQLTINGLYHPDEINKSVSPDLGMARADYIKNYLIFLGTNEQQLDITSQANQQLVSNKDSEYLGVATFSIKTVSQSTVQITPKIDVKRNTQNTAQKSEKKTELNKDLVLTKLADDIRKKPLVLYFQTGNAEIHLSDNQNERLKAINRYLSNANDAKVVITGYTDSSGNHDKNVELGFKRAKFAANYLEKHGLQRKQMVIISKGPANPIADNNTAGGRSKNRRVVVTVDEKQ